MLLSTSCKSCKLTIDKTYKVQDRVGIAQSYGNPLLLTCVDCGAENNYTPDDFKAVNNVDLRLKIFVGALGIALLGPLLSLLFLRFYKFADFLLVSFLALTPLLIFFIYIKRDKEAIRLFNRVKMKGRIANSKIMSTAQKKDIAGVLNVDTAQGGVNENNKESLSSNSK